MARYCSIKSAMRCSDCRVSASALATNVRAFSTIRRRVTLASSFVCARARRRVWSATSALPSVDIRDEHVHGDAVVAVGNLVRFLLRQTSERGGHVSLEPATHLLQLGDGASPVGGETELRARAGYPEHRDAIRRTNPVRDEGFRRAPRDLLVARRDVVLIEEQDVEMPARRALVGRDFRRDRPQRRLAIDAGGLLHVLEQQHRPRLSVLDDLHLVRLQIGDRPPGRVRHPHVEADDVDARPEDS